MKAGRAIFKNYNNGDCWIEYKNDTSPLTKADRTVNEIIVKSLKACFPQYTVLSEEEMDSFDRLKNDDCFIVGPLDGTKEFILIRNGHFTVNIALRYKHKSALGVIYVPVTDVVYRAVKGQSCSGPAEGNEAERGCKEGGGLC